MPSALGAQGQSDADLRRTSADAVCHHRIDSEAVQQQRHQSKDQQQGANQSFLPNLLVQQLLRRDLAEEWQPSIENPSSFGGAPG